MTDPHVSIIIVNWNGKTFLQDCLGALREQTYRKFEIILVDNASKDDSVVYVSKCFPEVKIVALQNNLGFAGGNNAGLKIAKGHYICLLNSDTKACPTWLKNLVRAMDKNPQIGICASKLLIHGTKLINSCGDGLTTAGMGYQIGQGEPMEKYSQKGYIFGGYGAAILYKKKMLDEIGFFDNDFFLIYEEDDLSFRAQSAGWKCLYVPDAIVYHKVSGSIGKRSDLAVYYMARNIELLWIKNMPLLFMIRYMHHKFIQEIAEFCFFSFIGRFKAYAKGKIDVIRLIPKMLNKRRIIQSKRKVSNDYLKQMLSSTWVVMFYTIKRLIKGC